MEADTELIYQRCRAMDDDQLVRVLTVEREQNTDQFHRIAEQVLKERDLSLEEFVDQVKVRGPQGPLDAPQSIDRALSHLDAQLPRGQLWLFTHALGQSLLVQREGRYWLVSRYIDEEYAHTCLVGDFGLLLDLLRRFLSLQE